MLGPRVGSSWKKTNGRATSGTSCVSSIESCEDALFDESLLADRSKIDNACVKVTCIKDGKAKCFLLFSSKCPTDRKTVVTLNADANFADIKFSRHVRVALNTKTACIENVRLE